VKNGLPAATGSSYSYTPTNGDVIYVRMVSNYECRLASMVTGESDTLSVVIPVTPFISIMADPGTTISQGQSLTLTASVPGGITPTYQWYLNGGLVHGATNAAFTYADYADKDTVTCKVANNTPCGELTAYSTVLITVNTVGVATIGSAAFDVRIMPNPTSGNFAIKGTIRGAGNEAVTIDVTDVLGQVIHRTITNAKNGSLDEHIKLGNTLANGMYMVNVHTATATKVFHIVLQQ
jgi:hypothetical protein